LAKTPHLRNRAAGTQYLIDKIHLLKMVYWHDSLKYALSQ